VTPQQPPVEQIVPDNCAPSANAAQNGTYTIEQRAEMLRKIPVAGVWLRRLQIESRI